MSDLNFDTSEITRFEVIDHRGKNFDTWGRAFVARPCKVDVSLQDDGRTLKVFVTEESND